MMLTMPPKPAKPRNNSFVLYRIDKKWSQAQMAEKLGYTRPHYASIEAMREKELSPRHLMLLAALKTANGD